MSQLLHCTASCTTTSVATGSAASPPAAAPAPPAPAPSCATFSDEKTDESEASSSLACGVTPANADGSIADQSPPISEPKRRSICGSTGSTDGS